MRVRTLGSGGAGALSRRAEKDGDSVWCLAATLIPKATIGPLPVTEFIDPPALRCQSLLTSIALDTLKPADLASVSARSSLREVRRNAGWVCQG